MTLAEWQKDNAGAMVETVPTDAIIVYSDDRALWNLADYRVETAIGGSALILVPILNR